MMCLSVSDTYHKISKAWVPTLFICVFTVRSFFFIFKKTDKKTFNPNRTLEAKHILFYYQADCLALKRRRSGLRQVTKTDKMPIRK